MRSVGTGATIPSMYDASTPAAATAATAADIVVENPVSGEEAGRVPDMTADVPALVGRARTAQAAWGTRRVEERAEVLGAMRRWIVANRTAIVASTMRETGKTYEDALFNEVFVLADAIRFWERKAARHLRDARIRGRGPLVLGRKFIVRRRPLGVVGVIAPWNYPLLVALGDSAPALMAGNAVVIKPSEITPLTTRMVVDGLVRETGLPEDVLLVATGRGDTGAALVDHVDMIMFTGSTWTGRNVAARAAERLIPVSLELGGKDPMIVCADANLDRAANAAATFGLGNCGQACTSVERIYVEDEVHDEFVDKLVRAVGGLRQRGNTSAGAADVGAMTSPPQARDRRAPRRGRARQGCAGAHRRQSRRRTRSLLRADRPRRRRSRHGLHARGNVRPDPARHEGPRRRRSRATGERLKVRPLVVGLHERHQQGRGDRATDPRRQHRSQRRLHPRRRLGGAVRRLAATQASGPGTPAKASSSTPSHTRS